VNIWLDEQGDRAYATLAAVAADVRRLTPAVCGPCPRAAILLLTALAHHHGPTYLHSLRVGHAAALVAHTLDCGEWQTRRIWLTGLLHDVGVIELPRSILEKHGNLTHDERVMVMQHPLNSARLLQLDASLAPLAPSVAAHHERLDGHGYPRSLRDSQIPYEAHVVAVVDALDIHAWSAGTSPSHSLTELREMLHHGAGSTWDATIVETVLHMLTQPCDTEFPAP
jgi:HD-GYP domain-containing protein (c-di-GMP phosphodiesterase class II)